MASNLACIGLGVDSEAELRELMSEMTPNLTSLGRARDAEVWRWQDRSGARLVMTTRQSAVTGFMPSFDGTPGARLAGVVSVNAEVSSAAVVDSSGEQLTGLTLELEQRDLVRGATVAGFATVVGLGTGVEVFADAAAFAASDASLLDPSGAESEPPEHFVAAGWPWPPRMGAESFISFGIFEPPGQATAHARLNGVVTSAERRVNSLTGQEFIVARVTTAGFEADLCLSAAEHAQVPGVGAVVGGVAFMVGSLESWTVESGAPASAAAEGSRLSRLFGRGRN